MSRAATAAAMRSFPIASRRSARPLSKAYALARPTVTLEIGMAWGMSTLSILSAQCERCRRFRSTRGHRSLASRHYRRAALLSLERAGAEALIEFHHQPSVSRAPQACGPQLDFVFVDGAHHASRVFCDLWPLHPLLRPGSVVVVDDVWFDDIQRACRSLKSTWGTDFTVNIRPAVSSPCSEHTWSSRWCATIRDSATKSGAHRSRLLRR